MEYFIQQTINGLSLGAIYALLALSYSLIFGVLRVINFALGETLMVGAYSSLGLLWFLDWLGLSHEENSLLLGLAAVIAAVAGGMIIGVLTEFVALRPLRHRQSPLLLSLISSLGVSIFLQNAVLTFVSSGNVRFPDLTSREPMTILGTSLSITQIVIVVASLCLMAGISVIVYGTRLGRQIRAVRDNPGLASEYGSNPTVVITVAFMLSGALAGFAGVAAGCNYGVARYNMGFLPGVKAFCAAILGGIGDVPGAVVGGFLIGFIEAMGAAYISAEYKDVLVFAVLILTLLFRPRGLLGRGIE